MILALGFKPCRALNLETGIHWKRSPLGFKPGVEWFFFWPFFSLCLIIEEGKERDRMEKNSSHPSRLLRNSFVFFPSPLARYIPVGRANSGCRTSARAAIQVLHRAL